jgi:hypothetical protein
MLMWRGNGCPIRNAVRYVVIARHVMVMAATVRRGLGSDHGGGVRRVGESHHRPVEQTHEREHRGERGAE